MIDTVILSVPKDKITFFESSKSTKWNLHSKSGLFSKHIKQLTSSQKKDGIYRPRLTVIKRGLSSDLKIEFFHSQVATGK